MIRLKKNTWLTVFALAALAALFAPDSSAGDRLVAQVDEAFEVHGTVYPAGTLSLERVRAVSPVATLNEIRVNGKSLGVFVAQDGDDLTTATRDELIFARRADGRLVLESVAFEGQPARVLYEFREQAGTTTWHAPTAESRATLMASSKN